MGLSMTTYNDIDEGAAAWIEACMSEIERSKP